MRRFKRILSAAVAVIMLGSSIPGNVYATGMDSSGYSSTVETADEGPGVEWTTETADIEEPETGQASETAGTEGIAETETSQGSAAAEDYADEADEPEDGRLEESAVTDSDENDRKQPSQNDEEDLPAEEPVFELSRDNAEQREAQEEAGEEQDPYIRVSVTGQSDEGFPSGAYADVYLLKGEELEEVTGLAGEEMAEYDISPVLPLEIGLYYSEDGVMDQEHDSKYEPGAPVTVRVYMDDTDFIDGKHLLHYAGGEDTDGTWEQIDYSLYEEADGELPYAEFAADSFSPFVFTDMEEKKEKDSDEPENEIQEEYAEETDLYEEGSADEKTEDLYEEDSAGEEADGLSEESHAVETADASAGAGDQSSFASGELVFTADSYKVTAAFDESAEIPDGTKLAVRELGGEEYEKHLEDVKDTFKDRTVSEAGFFDIKFQNEEGNEVIPRAEVSIQIQYRNGKKLGSGEEVSGVHFAKDGIETVDVKTGLTENDRVREVDFSAGSFSVYGVVYTVDFEHTDEETGKTYRYTLEGGSEIRLSELLPAVGIVSADKAGKYIDEQVADVQFSDPDYIRITHTDPVLGLFGHGDWILKSLRPFTTEETLTITLNDGSAVTVTVTDDVSSNIKVTLSLIDEHKCDTADATGNIFHLYPASYSGTEWTLYDEIGVLDDNGDGTYSIYLPESAEGDDSFAIHSEGEKAPDFNNEYSAASGTIYFSVDQASDGEIRLYKIMRRMMGYGPVYPELFVYDSLSGELINSDSGVFSMISDHATQDNWLQWNIEEEAFQTNMYFLKKSYQSGHYYYATPSSGYPKQPSGAGGTIGTNARVRIISAPDGYSDRIDESRSEYEFRIQEPSYYQGLTGYYIPGSRQNWVAKMYLYPRAMLRTVVQDEDDGQSVVFDSYALYEDEACTVPVMDINGDPVSGQSVIYDNMCTAEHKKWFDHDWNAYGTSVYLKLTGVDAAYSETGEVVAKAELLPHREFSFYRPPVNENAMAPVSLQKMASNIPLTVSVLDAQTPVPGRTVMVYEFDSQSDDYREEAMGTLTDNGDGTYSGLSLTQTAANRGEFRVQDEETGNAVSLNISGADKEEGVSAAIDISAYSDLLSIVKKDDGGNYEGDISLICNGHIIDSTTEEKEDIVVNGSDMITVSLFGISVDESKVRDNTIYTYQLPDELVPFTDGGPSDLVSGQWKYLAPTGNVRAYGRIVKMGGHYVFQIYFTNTEGQFNIEFGYRYSAEIADQYKNGGAVTAEWLGKPLSFNVEDQKKYKIWMEKKAIWQTRRYPFESSDDGSEINGCVGNEVNSEVPRFSITVHNDTEEELTMSLEEVLPPGLMLSDDTRNRYPGVFKVYIDRGLGDGYEEAPSYKYDACSLWTFSSASMSGSTGGPNSTGSVTLRPTGCLHSNYSYAATGFTANIKGVKCARLKIAYYAMTYYSGDSTTDGQRGYDRFMDGSGGIIHQSHNGGDSTARYMTTTKITDVSEMSVGDAYQKEAVATAVKSYVYGLSIGSFEMYRGFWSGGRDYDTTDAMIGSLHINSGATGGEHWIAFTASQPSIDMGQNYYFHSYDFVSDKLENSLQVYVNGNLINSGGSIRASVDHMRTYDYASYLELKEICKDSGYDLARYSWIPVYKSEQYINGITRPVWTVVSPETFTAAQNDGGTASPLLEYYQGAYYPGGIKVYVLGLDGTESLNFKYAMYQRTITPSADAVRAGAQDGIFRKIVSADYGYDAVGGHVSIYNRRSINVAVKGQNDQGTKSIIRKSGELLADGAIKWTIKVDISDLKRYYTQNSIYYNRNGSSTPSNYSHLFDYLPQGYCLSRPGGNRYGYNEDFIPEIGGNYQPGVLYKNVNGQLETLGSFYRCSNTWPNCTAPIFDSVDAISDTDSRYVVTFNSSYLAAPGDQGEIELVYITQPDSTAPSLQDGSFIYSASELVVPWANTTYKRFLVDSAASTYVYMPSASKKTLVRSEQDPEVWTASIDVPLHDPMVHFVQYDEKKPYYFKGTFSMFDNMQGVKALDKNGNILDIDGVARYIRLKKVDVTLENAFTARKTNIHLDIKDENITTSGDAPHTLVNSMKIPKFGFNRYSASGYNGYFNEPLILDVDYAPQKNTTGAERTEHEGHASYGGNYYGMNGGFELFLRGIRDGSKVSVSYDVEFDYESFARDYPEYGQITLLMTNDAYRHYYGFPGDTYKTSSDAQEWSFAVMPDLTKKCEEKDRSADYYTNTFKSEADVGYTGQTSVSLVDQISRIVLFDNSGGRYFFSDDPKASGGSTIDMTLEEAANEWLPYFKVEDLRLMVKNRFDSSVDTEIAGIASAPLGTVLANGGRLPASALQNVDNGWVITDMDTSGIADIDIHGLDGAQALNGNVFAWNISRANGEKIPAGTYFEIGYRLTLRHEREASGMPGGSQELLTPFRHIGKGYPDDLAMLLTNQMCILYNAEEAASGEYGGGTVTAGTAAAGAEATGRYLQFNSAHKKGVALENDGHKLRYKWNLVSEDWTAGTEEYLSHRWNDTLYVTAGLNSENVKNEQDAALGDDVLNAAWINLFYKHLKVTGWKVTSADTLAQAQAAELALSEETADGKLIFAGNDGERVTVIPDCLEKGADGRWAVKKQGEDSTMITDLTPDLYDLWGTGRYFQSYRRLTEGEHAGISGNNSGDYGYGIVHLFDVEEEHVDHMRTVSVSYTAEVDWDALVKDADMLYISDSMLSVVSGNSSIPEEYVAAVRAFVERQHVLDAMTEKLGLSGDEILRIGLAAAPDYNFGVHNRAQSDGAVTWEDSSWEHGVKAEGKMQKSAKVNDDGSVEWTIDLQNGDGTLTDFVIGDKMKADPSQEQEVISNTKTAMKHMEITDFAVMDGENNILYSCSGEDVRDHDFGSASGIYDNGSVTFEGIKDDQLMMNVSFDRVMSGQTIRIRYTTSLNEADFIKEGNLDTGIAFVNSAVSAKWNADASAEISNKNKGIEAEKKKTSTGRISDAGWKAEVTVTEYPALWLDIQDDLTVPDNMKEYMSVSRMKITKKENGAENETVIYDTDNNIDTLSEEHFSFANGFRLNENGSYSFDLLFNADKTDGTVSYRDSNISIPAGTKIVVEYVTSFDEKAWKEAGETNESTAFSLSNTVAAARNGFNKASASDVQVVAVHPETKKTGKDIGKDENGNSLVKWTADVYLNEMCTAEKLEGAETATITDIPESLAAMSLVEDSIRLYDLDVHGNAAGEIDGADYTIDVRGKKIVITLKAPSRHPMIRVELITSSPAGITDVTNRIEASVNGTKASSESEGVKIKESNGHYVKSTPRTGELLITKKDADNEETVLKDVPFAIYRLNCKEEHAHGPSCWSVMPCLIKTDHNDTYIYEYDSEYSEENGGNAYWETELITDKNGQINVIGLPYGTYRVIELEALPGYLNTNPGSIQDALSGSWNADRKDVYEFRIENSSFTPENPQVVSFEYDCLNKKTKVVVDKRNPDGAMIAGAHLQVKDSTGKVVYEWDTAEGKSRLIEGVLNPGTYTLHEARTPEGYETADDITFVLNTDGTVAVNSAVVNKVEMTDAYLVSDVKVKKTVAGNMGDRHRDFDFTITFKDENDAPYTKTVALTKNGNTENVTPDAEGKISFKLAHEEEIVFGNIAYGTKYEVTEADYSAEGYATTSKNTAGTIIKTNPDAVFKNSRGGAIPTGIEKSFPLMLGAAAAGLGTYLFYKKKRRDAEK